MAQVQTRRKWVSYSKAAGIIRTMIIEGSHSPQVLDLSGGLARCVSQDSCTQAQALWTWVRQHIVYIEDPFNDDLFQAPEVTIKRACGDCDDQVILLGSLLRSIGLEVRLVFVFSDRPKDYSADFPSHVFLQVNLEREPGRSPMWVDADTVAQPGPDGRLRSAMYGYEVKAGFREYIEVG